MSTGRMRSFVINLDRSPERMAWMSDQFHQFGILFERVPAVDGGLLTVAELRRHSPNRVDGMQWAPSEVGCLLSHRECWKRISSGTDAYGVVFEDDLHLSAEVAQLLSTDSWIPNGIDILKLEAPCEERIQEYSEENLEDYSVHLTDIPWNGTGCYILSKILADKLSSIAEISYPVDRYLFDNALAHREFRGYEIRPGVCIQASLTGTTDGPLASALDNDRRHTAALPRLKAKRSAFGILTREMSRPVIRATSSLRRKYRNWRIPGRPIVFPEQAVEVHGGTISVRVESQFAGGASLSQSAPTRWVRASLVSGDDGLLANSVALPTSTAGEPRCQIAGVNNA